MSGNTVLEFWYRLGLPVTSEAAPSVADSALHILIPGSAVEDLDSFYAATASLLNFPVYFSENLDSFDELMNDLGWLEEKSLRIYISEYANFLLEEPVKKRRQVLDILAKAALGGLLELYLIKSAESLDDLNQQKLEFTEVSEEA